MIRLIVIVGVLGYAVYWIIGFFSDGMPVTEKPQIEQTAQTPAEATQPIEKPPENKKTHHALPMEGRSLPMVASSYRFKNRPVPDSSALSALVTSSTGNDTGGSMLVDLPSNSVSWTLPADRSAQITDLLRAIDLNPKNYTCQVRIISTARIDQSGFDLTAFLTDMANVSQLKLDISQGMVSLVGTSQAVEAGLMILSRDSSYRVDARPQLYLTEAEKTIFESVQRVPLPSVSQTNSGTQSGIVFEDVGFSLELTPLTLHDGRVSLLLSQTSGRIGEVREVGGSEVPIIERQRISSRTVIKPSQWYVLGGLRISRETGKTSFFSKANETENADLVIMISIE